MEAEKSYSGDVDGRLSEDLSDIEERNRIIEEKVNDRIKQKELEDREMKAEEDKILLERKHNASKRKVTRIALFPFNPNNWIKLLQYYEELFYVIFIDAQIILPLFSLLYLSYIIINYDGNLEASVFKGLGCICICIICIVTQQFNSKQGK